MVNLKQLQRRRRIIELRCSGLTIPRICENLRENGLKISERTVWSDLHSSTTKDFVEELLRKQLADLTLLGDDYATRLKYRDQLLDKLMPRHIEQKTEEKMQLETRGWEADPELKRALLEEAERQRKEKERQDQGK